MKVLWGMFIPSAGYPENGRLFSSVLFERRLTMLMWRLLSCFALRPTVYLLTCSTELDPFVSDLLKGHFLSSIYTDERTLFLYVFVWDIGRCR